MAIWKGWQKLGLIWVESYVIFLLNNQRIYDSCQLKTPFQECMIKQGHE